LINGSISVGTVAGKLEIMCGAPPVSMKTRIFRGEAITTTPCRVLVVSASENRDVVTSAMSHWSMDPVCCSGVQEAYSLLPEASPSLIFCEETLVDGTYRDLLREISKFLKSRFVVISPTADLDQNYNEAIALGAFDMIASPCRRSDVQWIAIRAMHEDARRTASKRRPRPSPEKQKEELDANSEASAGGR
jgi:DNA-binding NtrC family response regulator